MRRKGVIWAEEGALTRQPGIRVPIAKCNGPKVHWHRVLPQEFLPRKRYSLPGMELTLREYRGGGVSLRKAVEGLKKKGLGRRTMGRCGGG